MSLSFLHILLLCQLPTAMDSLSESYYSKGKSYYFTQPDSTLYYANQLMMLDGESKDRDFARAEHLLGTIKQLRSESDSALVYFNSMLAHSKKASDSTLQSIALLSKGLMHVNLGKYDSAMGNYLEGERIASIIGVEKNQLRAMAEIARVSSILGDHEKALAKYREYLSKVRNPQHINELITGVAYISVEFMYLNMPDSSLFYSDWALKLQREIGNTVGVAAALQNKASVYTELNMPDSAISLYRRSRANYEKAGFTQGLGQLDINLGTLYLRIKDPLKALSYLEEGIQHSKSVNDLHALKEVYRLLAEAHHLLGHGESAYQALSRHNTYADSLFTIDKEREISEMQTKYETEKKEQQIAFQEVQLLEQTAQNQRNIVLIWSLAFVAILLGIITLLVRNSAKKKQDLLLKEAEIKLHESLLSSSISSQETERKRFARDLHDGFGQMISVLNLNLNSLEKGSSDKESVFESSAKVLDEMYKELKSICFNLMPETLIKNGVVDALKEFASRINKADRVQVQVNAFGVEARLPDLIEINLYRISQEWINNVIKYSDADTVTVQLTRDDKEITLLIEDNGSGFEKSILTQGNGNGWKNMQSRTNLMKGELELDTASGKRGNTFILNIPVEISAKEWNMVTNIAG